VAEAPEAAVRIVRDAHVPKRWEGECPKLEVVTKVGNRKHTAIILGPLAEATVLVGLEVGDVVQFYGAEVEEIVWQEGKPTRKEIVGRPPSYLMTDVQTVVDGKWRSVKEAMPTLLPPDPSPSSAPASSPEQPVPEPVADQVSSSAPPSLPITTPPRMKGTPGEWVTLQGPLVDAIQFTTKGDVPVAIMRVADETTGEIVFAALVADIEQQVGSASKPFAKAGDRVGLYGEWKGDWLVVEMVGLATP
jgi:hypothetical protein